MIQLNHIRKKRIEINQNEYIKVINYNQTDQRTICIRFLESFRYGYSVTIKKLVDLTIMLFWSRVLYSYSFMKSINGLKLQKKDSCTAFYIVHTCAQFDDKVRLKSDSVKVKIKTNQTMTL